MSDTLFTFEELTNSSIDELIAKSEERGQKFESTDKFVEFVKGEWKQIRLREILRYKDKPADIETLEIRAENLSVDLQCVDRSLTILSKVETCKLLAQKINDQPVLSTSHMSNELALRTTYTIADYHAAPIYKTFENLLTSFTLGTLFPLTLPFKILRHYIGQAAFHYQKSRGPIEASIILPVNLRADVKEKKGKKYNECEKIGAFNAEFVKHFTNEHINLICSTNNYEGAYIKHFLKNQIKNNKIIEKAQEAAEMLKTSPYKYFKDISMNRAIDATTAPISIIGGAITTFYIVSYLL